MKINFPSRALSFFKGIGKYTSTIKISKPQQSKYRPLKEGKYDEKISLISKNKISAELNLLREKAQKASVPETKDMALATYLLGRANLNKVIDGPLLESLKKANDSVNSTREQLPYGRGNVAQDIAHCKEGYFRTRFARTLTGLPHQGEAKIVARALKMKAGNCGEFANVAAYIHAAKLRENETLHIASKDGLDHNWAVLDTSTGEQIVLDPWAKGPAILLEDNNFIQNANELQLNTSWNKKNSKNFLKQTKENNKTLAGKKTHLLIGRQYNAFKSALILEKHEIPEDNIFAETAVLDQGFITKSFELDCFWSLYTRKVLRIEDVSTNINQIREKISLGNEVKKRGVARVLGANIRQGSEIYEQINPSDLKH